MTNSRHLLLRINKRNVREINVLREPVDVFYRCVLGRTGMAFVAFVIQEGRGRLLQEV